MSTYTISSEADLPYTAPANTIITISASFTILSTSSFITIAGSNVTINGANNILTVNVPSYPGLVYNITPTNTGIVVNNLTVNAGTGTLDSSNGWICQSGSFNCTLNYCNSNGLIEPSSGGLFGSNSSNCAANSCFTTGAINYFSGGIFGSNATGCTATYCYSTGAIGSIAGSTSGYAGGIFGPNAVSSIANSSYSTGNMLLYSGGIFGPDAATSSATNCYTLGKGDGNNVGGIFAPNSLTPTCTASSCYTTGAYLSGDGIFATVGTGNTKYSSYSEQYNSCGYNKIWQDKNAKCVLQGVGNIWIDINKCSKHVPFLLSTYNAALYNPAFSTTMCKTGSTNSGLFTTGTYYITRVNNKTRNKHFYINNFTGQINYRKIKCKKYTIGVVNGTYINLSGNLPIYTYNPCYNPCYNSCGNSNNNWTISNNNYYTLSGYNINTYQLTYCKNRCDSSCSSSSSLCSSSSSSCSFSYKCNKKIKCKTKCKK